MRNKLDPFDREANKSLLFDSTGRMLTVGLFKETSRASFPAPFSLADWHQIYLECMDPTEYRAAMVLLGDWEHWQLLRENKTLAAIFDQWHEELEVKLRSQAIGQLIEQAADPKGTAAARWLAEAGFSDRPKRKVGRPTKDESEKNERIDAKTREQVLKDAERLGLSVVNGSSK